MTTPICLPINANLSLYLFDEESVLFSKRSRQLYGLDRAATVILFRLEQGEEPDAVARDLGLPGASSPPVAELACILAGEESPAGEYRNDFPCPLHVPEHGDDLPRYRLLKTVFSVRGPDELLREWVVPYVAHLRTEDGTKTGLLIAMDAARGDWRLMLNGAAQGVPVPPERFIPMLHDRLRCFAYLSHPYLLTIHGTVVTREGYTLVLAGRSGSGKSTLAAALLARGYGLVSDEPAVIDPLSGGALPIPLGLGLKAGSWPALLPDYPALDSVPLHLRFDGSPIRYLLPDNVTMARDRTGYPATHLIFPEYRPGSAGKLEPFGPVRALAAIAEAGYHVPGLDEERVIRLLDWIADLACFSLTYSSTAEALALLNGVLK